MVVISKPMYDDTMTIEAYEALQNYFSHIGKTGYMRYDNVFKLLAFLYIEEMLHAYNSFDMSECDYVIIDNFLQCLYGTCLLPYPEFTNLPQVGGENEVDLLREVEWDVIRQTEDGSLRVIEPNTALAR